MQGVQTYQTPFRVRDNLVHYSESCLLGFLNVCWLLTRKIEHTLGACTVRHQHPANVLGIFLSRYIPYNNEFTDNTSHGGYYFTTMTPRKKKFTRKAINRRKKNTPRSPQRILAQARKNTDPSKGSHRNKAWKYSKFVVLPASQEPYEKVQIASIWSVWSRC